MTAISPRMLAIVLLLWAGGCDPHAGVETPPHLSPMFELQKKRCGNDHACLEVIEELEICTSMVFAATPETATEPGDRIRLEYALYMKCVEESGADQIDPRPADITRPLA